MKTPGPFHAQYKKIQNFQNDDEDLFYVNFSSIMDKESFSIEKNLSKHTQKNF